jgi:hypothetical protein
MAGLLLAALPLWGILAGLAQPVSARPVNASLPMTVVINEVAWMGTKFNATDEWIELYNPGPSTINITGWVLKTTESPTPAINVTLSGSIVSGGYFLLERTDDTTINDITRDQIYTGDLNNSGATLQLFDGSVLIDTANLAGTAWPAGNNTTKCSMERVGVFDDAPSAWVTNNGIIINGHDAATLPVGGNPICGSPKSQNSVFVTPTSTPTATTTATVTATPTETLTPTITSTATVTPTVSQTVTVTPTGTVTLTPTISATVTITATRTLTLTRTLTPTKTTTSLVSSTATQTATRTVTATPSRILVIDEIAWMGTLASSADEWIKLYNPGLLPVNVNGWKLFSTDTSPTILLTGTIPAGGYMLLERTDNDTVRDVVVANAQLYSGELTNSGESLSLVDASSTLIDTANGNGGLWPAGNVTSFCSMQRIPGTVDSDSSWVTASIPAIPSLDADGNPICGSPRNDVLPPTLTPTRTRTPTRTPTKPRTSTPVRTATPIRTATPKKTATKTPNRTTPEAIVINEFLSQPRTDWNGDGKVDSGDGFIELKNLSTVAITINGYRLDDQDGDSLPYTIKDVTMQPGTRKVFFASQTGILLSTGGDSVRLFKSSGSLPSDAFTYGVIKVPDQTWCRLPDSTPRTYEVIAWKFGCAPTPGDVNKLAESVFIGNQLEAAICLSKKLPAAVYQAECDPLGLAMWDQSLWDALLPEFPRYFDLNAQEFLLE